jgi:hypothetical protein
MLMVGLYVLSGGLVELDAFEGKGTQETRASLLYVRWPETPEYSLAAGYGCFHYRHLVVSYRLVQLSIMQWQAQLAFLGALGGAREPHGHWYHIPLH